MLANTCRRIPRGITRQFFRRSPHLRPAASPLRCDFPRMASKLSTVQPPVSTALPADSFQLLSTTEKAGEAEDALFEEQVKSVNDWWASPRFAGIRRPYTAEAVVSKRGTLHQSYPSSVTARKLFNLLELRAAEKQPVHTRMLILIYIFAVLYICLFASC